MLENLSSRTQILLLIIGLALLFWAVLANHKRNKKKQIERHEKKFGKKLTERRRHKEQKNKNRD